MKHIDHGHDRVAQTLRDKPLHHSPLLENKGAVLVEFAVALPLMMFIILGIFDFGFAFQRYLVLTNAAREGARIAVLQGFSRADVENRVADYAHAGGVGRSEAVHASLNPVLVPGPPAFTVYRVDVDMDYTFPFIGSIGRLFGGSFGRTTLHASSAMRTEIAAGGS